MRAGPSYLLTCMSCRPCGSLSFTQGICFFLDRLATSRPDLCRQVLLTAGMHDLILEPQQLLLSPTLSRTCKGPPHLCMLVLCVLHLAQLLCLLVGLRKLPARSLQVRFQLLLTLSQGGHCPLQLVKAILLGLQGGSA